ncbi:uncharacterized protein LOC108598935 [Drosophila busckii]|uniref:uncharacterized protein LOC108598935 n=1 Tax=Drosophila busckii TaxID=30019 RepID=UPI0014331B09|nr:uncharacterized protein LOC108598935 [Drosophila busckii]
MLFMQSYFFCASVRLGVIIISIFAMAKSIVVMYIILTHGIDFLPMMIDKFDTESAYRESYFMVKDTIDWMEQDPKVATVLLQVYSISHIVSCLAAAYGAYKLKKLFVLPLACFEFTYLLQIVAMVILFLRISRHFLNLSSLILVTLIATAYAILVFYDLFALLAFVQIVTLVSSKRYQQFYGTNPFKPCLLRTQQAKLKCSLPQHNSEKLTEYAKYFQPAELMNDIMLRNALRKAILIA